MVMYQGVQIKLIQIQIPASTTNIVKRILYVNID